MSHCMQAEHLTKYLQLEQQKAEQDRAKWERREADMQHSLQETMNTSQRLQDAKDSVEHSNLQELHRQLMAELQQRNDQIPQVWLI
jgi:ERCC4-related helicase